MFNMQTAMAKNKNYIEKQNINHEHKFKQCPPMAISTQDRFILTIPELSLTPVIFIFDINLTFGGSSGY